MKKADSAVQVRVSSEDKKAAAEILESLGLDISTAVNMLLKQIIIQKRLPFTVSMQAEAEKPEEDAASGNSAENR